MFCKQTIIIRRKCSILLSFVFNLTTVYSNSPDVQFSHVVDFIYFYLFFIVDVKPHKDKASYWPCLPHTDECRNHSLQPGWPDVPATVTATIAYICKRRFGFIHGMAVHAICFQGTNKRIVSTIMFLLLLTFQLIQHDTASQ